KKKYRQFRGASRHGCLPRNSAAPAIGCTVIYCSTRQDTEDVCNFLRKLHLRCEAYHAGMHRLLLARPFKKEVTKRMKIVHSQIRHGERSTRRHPPSLRHGSDRCTTHVLCRGPIPVGILLTVTVFVLLFGSCILHALLLAWLLFDIFSRCLSPPPPLAWAST